MAIDSQHIIGFDTITPDARYGIGKILDRKSDPERFKEIESQRWGILEVATGVFTEIHRLSNPQMQALAFSSCADDEWIVWMEAAAQPSFQDWTLYAYHIPTKQLKQIAKAPTDAQGRSLDTSFIAPSVDHGYVVWTEPTTPGDPHTTRRVKLMHLATGATRALTDNGLAAQLSWPHAAWVETQTAMSTQVQGASQGLVVVMNVETGERETLTQPDTPIFIALHGEDLVWIAAQADGTSFTSQKIMLTNLQETATQVITSTTNSVEQYGYPSISDRFITWRANLGSQVYDRVLGRLVVLDTAEWQTEPTANGNGLVWIPQGDQTRTQPPEEWGLLPNKGVIHVLDASKLPMKPPGP